MVENDLLIEFKNLDYNSFNIEDKKKFCEKLLFIIHSNILKNYNENATKISSLMNNGFYNCVSSSIIYTIFLLKYNIVPLAIETVDHVFIEIDFSGTKIDVETTNKFGFDPGKKKDVLDEFGKVTGFRYVPAVDYKNRNVINIKKMLFLVTHNLVNYYSKNKENIKQANLSYIIKLGRNDKKGEVDFNTGFYNYCVNLINEKKYFDVIQDINSYFANFGFLDSLINIRFDTILNLVDSANINDFLSFENLKNYLIKENNRFPNLKNNQKIQEAIFYIYYKYITKLSNENKFDLIFDIIFEYDNNFSHPEMEKVVYNTLAKFIQINQKNNNLDNFFIEIKNRFPKYKNIINTFEQNYIYNKIVLLLNNKEFDEAFKELKKVENKSDKNFNDLKRNYYINYSVFLFNERKIEKMLEIVEMGLKEFPQDSTLIYNYNSFLLNLINENLKKEDYKKVREYLEIALKKFPNDKNFNYYNNELKSRGF